MSELSYLKVFLDWTEATRKLKDSEKGRLIDALVAYARGEEIEDSRLTGNEAYVFPMFQLQIDRDKAEMEKKRETNSENGKKGGAPKGNQNARKNDQNQPKTTENNRNKPDKDKDKDDDHDHDDDNHGQSPARPPSADVSDAAFDRFWEAYPKKQGKGAARKAFKVAKKKVPLDVILSAVERQRQSFQWNQNGGQYIPSPARWLSEERWNDEMRVDYGGYQQQPPPPNPAVPNASAHSSKPLRELMEERKAREAQNHDGL